MSRTVDVIALDVGSSFLRTFGSERLVRESAWDHRGIVRRGAVADPRLLRAHLRRAVGRAREVALSMPVSASEAEESELVEAAASGLRARRVVTLAAPVAALRSSSTCGPQVIIDVGADLVETSWAEPGGFHVGTRLPWGVHDVLEDLTVHVIRAYGIRTDRWQLGPAWAGSVVVGRDIDSGAARVVRITSRDIAAVLEHRASRIADAVRRLLAAPRSSGAGVVLVGGGACVVDIRQAIAQHLAAAIVVPPTPSHAVVRGLSTT